MSQNIMSFPYACHSSIEQGVSNVIVPFRFRYLLRHEYLTVNSEDLNHQG